MENNHHRMDRRSRHKRYGLPGTYHITIKANEVYRMLLGRVGGEQSLCLAVYQGKRRKSLHRRTLFVQSFWLLMVDFQ